VSEKKRELFKSLEVLHHQSHGHASDGVIPSRCPRKKASVLQDPSNQVPIACFPENLTQKHKGRCVIPSLENTSSSIHSMISPSRLHSVRTTGFVADTVLSFRSLPTASSQSSFLSISQDTGFHPKTSSPHTSTAGPLLHPQLLLRTPARHYHHAMKRGGGSRGHMEWWILRKGCERMMRMER